LPLIDGEYSDVIIGVVVQVIEDHTVFEVQQYICGGYCISNNIVAAAVDTDQI
jgi:hypothetical protein